MGIPITLRKHMLEDWYQTKRCSILVKTMTRVKEPRMIREDLVFSNKEATQLMHPYYDALNNNSIDHQQ